ncbi:MAG TPA: hypothetical protein ACFYED_00030 [Candidatus Tripitaka californicus]|uniref:hypothetical protein n=1 Tax=Candidatus Tripitaka californicus TaxID=3367616 RepID=UPI00402845C6
MKELTEAERELLLEKLAPVVLGSTGNLSWLRGPCGVAWLRTLNIDAASYITRVYGILGRAVPVPLLLEECISAEHPNG